MEYYACNSIVICNTILGFLILIMSNIYGKPARQLLLSLSVSGGNLSLEKLNNI